MAYAFIDARIKIEYTDDKSRRRAETKIVSLISSLGRDKWVSAGEFMKMFNKSHEQLRYIRETMPAVVMQKGTRYRYNANEYNRLTNHK